MDLEDWQDIYCGDCGKKFYGLKGVYGCVNCRRPVCGKCAVAVCKKKGCKSALCNRCIKYSKGKNRAKCKVHKLLLGNAKYLKPRMKKATKEKKDKFDSIRGWAF
jgi:hypothetical protein